MSKTNHSDFWLDEYNIDWDFSADSDDIDVSNTKNEATAHLIRLSAARRAIANYVTILTNKTIPVMFNDANISMTDGSVVYIGADINEKDNFDVAVGLALHEGSHICYSDFDLFKTMWQRVPREIYDYTENLGINKEKVAEVCRTILNIVEDRYIDYTIYKNAPGYRGYYQNLYDRYFNTPTVNDGLKSKLYRKPSIESYLYRLINITNVNTDLKALPGLYDIAKILDLSNINRLDTPQKRLEIALEISKLVFKNIVEYVPDAAQPGPGQGDVKNPNGDTNNEGGAASSADSKPTADAPKTEDSQDNADGKDSKEDASDIDDVFGGTETKVDDVNSESPESDIGDDPKISKTKQNKIVKAFEKQKDFVDGKIKKKKVTKKENQILGVLEQSKIDLIDVGNEYLYDGKFVGTVECVLVKNMTRELVFSDEFPLKTSSTYFSINDKNFTNNPTIKNLQKCIDEGISMGIKIGKRLQFRNEVNVDKFSRRETGKIDKRLIHELGCEAENVFYTIATHKYKKMNFHISVDASSSMRGEKWDKTMRLCTAIAKAASMLDNIRVIISFRTTMDKMPYVVIGYDSSVDKFVKIQSLFACLQPDGLTPEGLTFEAIMRVVPKSADDTDSYFINISDGEPCFHFFAADTQTYVAYNGESAAQHTRKQVKKIREMNYHVLSYFISQNECMSNESRNAFKTMYGNDSVFINVNNINQIVNTLNKKLLESVDN
jgi:hypothetical protein